MQTRTHPSKNLFDYPQRHALLATRRAILRKLSARMKKPEPLANHNAFPLEFPGSSSGDSIPAA